MVRRKSVILWLSIAAAGFYALMTGGLAVISINDFGGQREIRLTGALKSDISLAPRCRTFGVPFLVHYYGGDKPFGLRLQIWDEAKQYRAIDITGIIVEYIDGEVIRKADPWFRELKAHVQYNSSSSGIIQKEIFMLSDQIEELVLRHANAKITLKGQLIKVNGERIAFEVSEAFKAESRFNVTTFWEVLAGA